MVRADGETAPEGPSVPDPLRGRRRPGLRGGRRRATGAGRAAEAIREVRPDAPPGEDPAGAVPAAAAEYPTGPSRGDRPGTFDLLGFTHYWGRSLKGNWVVKRKTAKDRFSRALQSVAAVVPRASPPPGQRAVGALTAKLRGHYGYYGITGNSRSLLDFLYQVTRAWHKWLCRRSTRRGSRGSASATGAALPAAPGTAPKRPSRHVANPWPEEPDAGIAHVRICGGPGWATARGYPTVEREVERVM